MSTAALRVEAALTELGAAVQELLLENEQLRKSGGRQGATVNVVTARDRLRQFFKTGGNRRVETQEWKPVVELESHRDGVLEVSTCAFNPRLGLSCSANGTLILWDLVERAEIATVFNSSGALNSARFHPAKPLICTGYGDGTCRVYRVHDAAVSCHSNDSVDLTTPRARRSKSFTETDRNEMDEAHDPLDRVARPQDAAAMLKERVLVEQNSAPSSLSMDENIRPRGRSNSQPALGRHSATLEAAQVCNEHQRPVTCADWVANADMLATGSWDEQVIIWQLAEGEARILQKLSGHNGRISNLDTLHNSRIVLTSSNDQSFRLWDLRSSSQAINVFHGHTSTVTSAVFSLKHAIETVASCSEDRTIRMWDLRMGNKPFREILTGTRVNRMKFSPSGLLLTAPGDDGSLTTYNFNGEIVSAAQNHSRGILTSVAYASDESMALTSGWDALVTGWSNSINDNQIA